MDAPVLLLLLTLLLSSPLPSSTLDSLSQGSSLSVGKPEQVLISQSGIFSAGFYPVGDNACCLAIWFTKPSYDGKHTAVWMANRNQPVNGNFSKLSLLESGDLILTDAGRFIVWTIKRVGISPVQLHLFNTGNLVLRTSDGVIQWQSFDSPTDTLLPHQPLTRNTRLVSSRTKTNFFSGFYKLYFDNNNVLSLVFDGRDASSIYWPPSWLVSWQAGRSAYNSSRTALLDYFGYFSSTDDFKFQSSDFGERVQRRLTLDIDGNLRLYSFEEGRNKWVVTWQAITLQCNIHGICGPNSICTYVPGSGSGRRCSCVPGYEMKNRTDRTYGCIPKFNLSCDSQKVGFLPLPHVEFYGYDYGYYLNYTLQMCEKLCLKICGCIGYQYSYNSDVYKCCPKRLFLNGCRSPSFGGHTYLKLPKASLLSYEKPVEEFMLDCSGNRSEQLVRSYAKARENEVLKFILWFTCAIGAVEMICISMVWCFLMKAQQNTSTDPPGYILAATGFRKFTYIELKKATRGFSEEIGRGGGGVVYKGVLSDHRVAAIKQLSGANQGESEFLAEVSTIGRLNHMNLIEMWGYCFEGKHRLLVYEYMEHGSLAQNLTSNTLDWQKRFDIAVGTAKGLAYLHEECLEWVIHCDVKPQNILLDSNYQPKVADFGLSKLQNRGGINNSRLSRIRGTRGYMAPEWVLNLPITSKVDVYSYGIVVLEMITGLRSVANAIHGTDGIGERQSLVAWVKGKMNSATAVASWIEEILDPSMESQYDMGEMEILVAVALQCVELDKDERPTMSQVVETLLRPERGNNHHY
ncbi:putative receptor protein kinase ZmPK1 [Vitis vinifera]|uniref:putative receptor protein kinase ZmPK1 n=1 Tax=Vitis vinifera TaxID=29760 RepID=UPI00015C7C85|nr:putative receptor protein kinase ZmPK1 [Vitis vinifera]|eukprot:XP_002283069.1 PREDICTED: putative receptor protein kinase ZmPK1 [Vitis vinifera]